MPIEFGDPARRQRLVRSGRIPPQLASDALGWHVGVRPVLLAAKRFVEPRGEKVAVHVVDRHGSRIGGPSGWIRRHTRSR
jgi:hypothetical protein